MMIPVDIIAPAGPLLAAGDLRMPFPDTVKYCILGISITLLLVALGILAWQAFRCWTHTTYTQQDVVNSNLLYPDRMLVTAAKNSGTPSTALQYGSTELHRLSRSLSLGLVSSSGSNHADLEEQVNVKKVDGSLRFSIYYDQLQSQLVVTVLQAEGLTDQSQTHILQPFVKLSLMWQGSKGLEECRDEEVEGTSPGLWTVLQEWQTHVVKGSCNPLFGDQFNCILREEKQLHHINLKMEVRDFDRFSRHTVLGEVRVPLGQLNISYPLELQQDLQMPQKDLAGEVLLSLKFLPTSQRLEVGVLKIKTVLNDMCSDAAMYAKICVQHNQHKLRHQKTSTVSQCQVTVFNEVLVFPLLEFPLKECKIVVCVYKTYMTKSAKNLIGQLTVGKTKNSEDKHWSLMMRLVRQPVAKWHSLLI